MKLLAGMKKLTKKKMIWCSVIGSGVLVLAVGSGVIFLKKDSNSNAAEITVQSTKAEKGSISTTVTGTGTVESSGGTDVVVPAGIQVEEVLVEAGDTVEEGQELATVNEASVASKLLEINESIEDVEDEIDDLTSEAQTEGTTEYLQAKVLNGELSELTETQTALNTLLETKAITATCAGTISSVNVSADTEITQTESASGSTGNNVAVSTGTAATGSGQMSAVTTDNSYSLTFMSTAMEIQMEIEQDDTQQSENTQDDAQQGDTTQGDTAQDDTQQNETEQGDTVTIGACEIKIEAPETGMKPQSELAENDQYTGTISWNCQTDTFQAETVYTATIKLTAKEGYIFSSNIIPEVPFADVMSEVRQSDAGESILVIKAKFAKTGAEKEESGNSKNPGTENTENSTSGSNAASEVSSSGSTSRSVSASSDESSDTVEDTSTTQYSVYEAAAFTITSQEEAAVSINVDELDILSVKEGQNAVLTLDALDGQEFEGTITKVSSSATTGNSSTKYPVTITLEKTEDMRLGMSASAVINIDEAKDAVVIPVDALQERGGSTFVYTEKDSEGNLSGEVEVETGLSDGSRVEITSGLEEGDEVYYLKAQSTDDNSENMNKMMDGQMPGGGERPSGGGMPSGGDMPGGAPGGTGKSQ